MVVKERLKAYLDKDIEKEDYQQKVDMIKNILESWELNSKQDLIEVKNKRQEIMRKMANDTSKIKSCMKELSETYTKSYVAEDTIKAINEMREYIFEKIEVEEKKNKLED